MFWPVVAASLTAMVGFWATLALNICDFTRFSRSQRDQVIGQTIGLPVPMALFSFIGVAVTSATVVIFGKPIWQPVDLAAHLGGFGAAIALVVICLCTLTVNMAANVVSPSYDFSNLWPSLDQLRRAAASSPPSSASPSFPGGCWKAPAPTSSHGWWATPPCSAPSPAS